MVHFPPSRANLEGFLPLSEAGFEGFVGRFADPPPLFAAGTTLDARRLGFLCVISDLSTLRSPFVTSSPRFRSAKTAAAPPAEAACAAAAGGGGGGGGGADPGAEAADENWFNGTPYIVFRKTSEVDIKRVYTPSGSMSGLWCGIPSHTCVALPTARSMHEPIPRVWGPYPSELST